jgi:NADPH:quinone reductase-like Zn-dependent oxidoreductase
MPRPFIVGPDLVGTVAEANPAAGYASGQRVWSNGMGHGGRWLGWQEWAYPVLAEPFELADGRLTVPDPARLRNRLGPAGRTEIPARAVIELAKGAEDEPPTH